MALLGLRRLGLAAAAAGAAAALCVTAPVAAQEATENQVKAAYLFNFTKFVRWPAAAAAPDRFNICVIGDQPFAASLDTIIQGESVDGRPLVRLEPDSIDAARGCQILFIGSGARAHGARYLDAVRDAPVLTVGDTSTFLDQGGTIRFVRTGDRLRFDVNLPAASRAGLEISSKLLRVARDRVGVQ
jgi:YfiR/HmsC-like